MLLAAYVVQGQVSGEFLAKPARLQFKCDALYIRCDCTRITYSMFQLSQLQGYLASLRLHLRIPAHRYLPAYI